MKKNYFSILSLFCVVLFYTSNLSAQTHDIRYNQVSYLVGREKLINIVSTNDFTNISYSVVNSSNVEVLSGSTGTTTYWNNAASYVATIDITSLDTEDDYRIITSEKEVLFKIRENNYSRLAKASLKSFYYNRASTSIPSEYGGQFSRDFGHPDTEVIVHSSAASDTRPEGTIISSPKGWYDAGDYNKYVVNSGISTYTLLAAYEHYKPYYDSLEYNIPEKGGDLPDILDEVIWNLDWLLSMQDPGDGGVYHKLAGQIFSGSIMPSDYDIDRYVVTKTTSAALNFAAVMATAARIFADFESIKPGYSAALLQASKDAYEWAKLNPTIYFNKIRDVGGGNYLDYSVTDEFQWAATELYISSLETTYLNDIDISQINGNVVPHWVTPAFLALISLMQHSSTVQSNIDINAVQTKILTNANNIKNIINNNAMRIVMADSAGEYEWGSNGRVSNKVLILIIAFEITNDDSYLNAAFTAMDYLLGRNGTGFSFVTGFGDATPIDPHHRISKADLVEQPVPGMLVGGPIKTNFAIDAQEGGCGYSTSHPATRYIDSYCSWSTNEVAINWNAPFAYAVNALQFYQSLVYPTLPDDDNDGVANNNDLCENTSEGEEVNVHGCPEVMFEGGFE